jgi:hypothetical protein
MALNTWLRQEGVTAEGEGHVVHAGHFDLRQVRRGKKPLEIRLTRFTESAVAHTRDVLPLTVWFFVLKPPNTFNRVNSENLTRNAPVSMDKGVLANIGLGKGLCLGCEGKECDDCGDEVAHKGPYAEDQ